MVNNILGGFAGRESSSNPRKKHLKVVMKVVYNSKKFGKPYNCVSDRVIAFAKEGFDDAVADLDDKMVISAAIADAEILHCL